MNIIRVEGKSSSGTWLGHYQCGWVACGPGHQPLPCEDGIPNVDTGEFFGFASAAQATAWFATEEGREAIAQARRVVVYEVPDDRVKVGRTQVVFPMELAKVIGHIPPKEWVSGRLNMRDGLPEEWQ